jgi:hypothetical protein
MAQPMRVVAFAVSLLLASSAAAQDPPPNGIFVGTPDGPQEVAVYANRVSGGRLRPGVGTLDDVQRVSGVIRLICSLPLWRMRAVWLSTARVLQDDRTERRVLKFRSRRMSFTTTFVQIVATEDPAELKKVLDQVGATAENPAYVFVTMENGGMIRDYIVGIDPEPE